MEHFHELGHVLDLSHCNAADDSITIGCSDSFSDTDDLNVLWHVMASGSSWGLTSEQRATWNAAFAQRNGSFYRSQLEG